MTPDKILIRGAREHNLKGINLDIPRNKLVVITGLSGSGKSSLAFDTIYAEGQRRYVESLSAYARQFLEQMEKPDVEYIEGLSPAISIGQRTAGANPRSTVGTVTEIYDYLRLLYARAAPPYCYKCGRKIEPQTVQQIVDRIMDFGNGTKILVLGPLVRGRKGEYQKIFDGVRRDGFVRVRVDGEIHDVDEKIKLAKYKKHDIEVVVDRLVIKEDIKSRLADSVETALRIGSGIVMVNRAVHPSPRPAPSRNEIFSEHLACIHCGISYEELTPRMFSFNSPYGACRTCDGLGTKLELDPGLVVPDKSKSINEGAIETWRRGGRSLILYYRRLLRSLSKHYDIDMDTPFEKLTKQEKKIILHGSGDEEIQQGFWRKRRYYRYKSSFEGVIPNLERRFHETESDYVKEQIHQYMSVLPCPDCEGKRLRPESLAVRIQDKPISDITKMSVKEALSFFSSLRLPAAKKVIGREILKEVRERLKFMLDVGLDYLTIDRSAGTLSGGEAERIRLATQIGSGLVGVLYILDEPSIGLHQRDNRRLLHTLEQLRDIGNTVIVVEHDETTIRSADYIIDLGPGAGLDGGEVVACGGLSDILKSSRSLTGKYLSGELYINIPDKRKHPDRRFITIKGARENNLKNIDVRIPVGVFTCITGVSGSGKSTLVDDILHKALAHILHRSKTRPGDHDRILGTKYIDKIIVISQSPIGRTPRSNPATYTGVFSHIRELLSRVPDARVRGYKPGRFSFNVKGGRCEKCQGDGIIKIEMHFLPDIYVKCQECNGRRYNRETLEVYYKGKNIADVLEMSVKQNLEFFKNIPQIKAKLQTLYDVGLGYIKLGQSATTLSGGEAQRVKLSKELSKKSTGKTVYILDEPTTGLHFADIEKLLAVLRRLTDADNTVVVIEHNLDVIKTADYIIDLGPEGGDEGGEIVAEGTPEKIAASPKSYTGKFLKQILKQQGQATFS